MNGNTIILEEIKKYDTSSDTYQELAASELLQKIILAGLSRTDFFDRAAFHGGTALRIFFNLDRFSQDLDFSLLDSDKNFTWSDYLIPIQKEMMNLGCNLEIYDKSNRNRSIVIAEIRDTAIGKILGFEWATRAEHPKKIMVKLELNSNPPDGSKTITKVLSFPYQCVIRLDDLSTLFAGKCHALLCRDYGEYIKGRDWYDFLWYTDKKIEPNYRYLSESLYKDGGWKGQKITVNQEWLEAALKEKIHRVDIDILKADVLRFVNNMSMERVNNWNRDTFLAAVDTFHKNHTKMNKQKAWSDDLSR
jgi:predicted nucleotidyltransferase component of viral defense system